MQKLIKAIKYPHRAARFINRLSHHRVPWWNYRERGTDFIAEDWDNLLILDACRYDLFKSEHTFDGKLNHRYSMCGSTTDFLHSNIDGADLRDTVYLSANGQIKNHEAHLDINFHAVEPLYSECWSDELKTVPPAAVTDRAIRAESEYPDKRLLIHYVQPHFPFIGSETQEDKKRKSELAHEKAFWDRVFDGETSLSDQEIWEAYRDTLRLALPEVERALDELSGKSVVTSDHGNMIGDRGHPIPIKEYGHPSGVYYEKIVKVPWFESNWYERKQITSEESSTQKLEPDPAVSDRLEQLGYK